MPSAALVNRQERVVDNPGTATYGAIVVTSAIVAAGSHDDRPWPVIAKVGATLLVFWLAHVHTAFIAARFRAPDATIARALGDALHHELIMLEIAIAPLASLLAGALGVIEFATAVTFGLWAGVAELFAIGLLHGRRAGYRPLAAIAIAVIYAAVGAGLIALKVAVH
ncbi:MAG TPA: hypothetical protein VFP84_12975 [Kofleriaceae bacterium]|nr:hypothetical protein [Kofleriaceae bacterium]